MPYLTTRKNLKLQLSAGLVASYDIQPRNGVGPFWDTHTPRNHTEEKGQEKTLPQTNFWFQPWIPTIKLASIILTLKKLSNDISLGLGIRIKVKNENFTFKWSGNVGGNVLHGDEPWWWWSGWDCLDRRSEPSVQYTVTLVARACNVVHPATV